LTGFGHLPSLWRHWRKRFIRQYYIFDAIANIHYETMTLRWRPFFSLISIVVQDFINFFKPFFSIHTWLVWLRLFSATSWSHSETSSTAPPCKFYVSSVNCLLMEMLNGCNATWSPIRLFLHRSRLVQVARIA